MLRSNPLADSSEAGKPPTGWPLRLAASHGAVGGMCELPRSGAGPGRWDQHLRATNLGPRETSSEPMAGLRDPRLEASLL